MELKYKKDGSILKMYLYGELDEFSASNAKNMLDKILNDNIIVKTAIFDLSGLSFMDSTGIGMLIGRYKKLKSLGIDSYITGAGYSVEKVIQVCGLYSIMPKC